MNFTDAPATARLADNGHRDVMTAEPRGPNVEVPPRGVVVSQRALDAGGARG